MELSSSGIHIPFTEHLGIKVVEANREHAVVTLEKRIHLQNSLGGMHGGVLMTMLDLVMSWAVRGHYSEVASVITVDMSIGFLKAGMGDVTAEARVLHAGKSTAFCDSEARDEHGALLAKAIGTFKLLRDRKGG